LYFVIFGEDNLTTRNITCDKTHNINKNNNEYISENDNLMVPPYDLGSWTAYPSLRGESMK